MFYNMFFGDCFVDVTGKRAGNGGLGWREQGVCLRLFAFVYILKGYYRIGGYGKPI